MDSLELELQVTFLDEADELLIQAEVTFMAIDSGQYTEEDINKIFRIAHNIKGSAKSVGFNALAAFAHIFEDTLTKVKNGTLKPDRTVCNVFLESLDQLKTMVAKLRSNPPEEHHAPNTAAKLTALLSGHQMQVVADESAPSSEEAASASLRTPVAPSVDTKPEANKVNENEAIRVSTKKLDQLVNAVGELVVNLTILSDHRHLKTLNSDHALQTLAYVEKIVHEIQERSMALRMVPVKPLFQKLQRAVRDAAVALQKDVAVDVIGEEIELDKTLVDKLADPLTHIVRNAADHGIESAETRIVAGKPVTGSITIRAEQREDQGLITVTDDGAGLDADKILHKAIEKGLVRDGVTLSKDEIYQLLFAPGFSTRDQVSEISGRGVGLDVVSKAVNDMKGTIRIETELGKGASWIISMPLSMSIVPGIVIEIDDLKYVVPVPQLLEIINLNAFQIQTSTGHGRMLNLRGDVVPVFSLSDILHGRKIARVERKRKDSPGIVTTCQGRKVTFEVGDIVGQQQIVLKRLGDEVVDTPGLTAGAILANGEPGIVLNLHQIAKSKIQVA
jgi:two-component system chemotaxis sensor kinase CheA